MKIPLHNGVATKEDRGWKMEDGERSVRCLHEPERRPLARLDGWSFATSRVGDRRSDLVEVKV